MQDWYQEECAFEAEVLGVRGGPKNCRAGHEEGDRFTFAYRTPEGLCGELYHQVFPLLQALRAKGDMRTFNADNQPNEVTVWCPCRVVRLQLIAVR